MRISALFIFIAFSVLLHLGLGASLYFSSSKSPAPHDRDVLDLTIAPLGNGGTDFVKSFKPKRSAPASAPIAPKENHNSPLASTHSATDENTKSTQHNTSNGESSAGSAAGEVSGVQAWDSLTVKPRVLREVKARYTAEALAQKLEGLVIADLLINEKGHVHEASLIKGLGAGLDEAALAALRRFEFSAARLGERTVAVRVRYKYRFELQHQ